MTPVFFDASAIWVKSAAVISPGVGGRGDGGGGGEGDCGPWFLRPLLPFFLARFLRSLPLSPVPLLPVWLLLLLFAAWLLAISGLAKGLLGLERYGKGLKRQGDGQTLNLPASRQLNWGPYILIRLLKDRIGGQIRFG